MANKLSPCCVRRVAQAARARADLDLVARKAARRPDRDWSEEIRKAKAEVESTKQAAIDHEAEHAEEFAMAALA